MMRFHTTIFLLSIVTSLHIADAQELSLPQLGDENAIPDSFNMRNDSASSKIADYDSYDFIELGNFDSIVVKYVGSSENPLFDSRLQIASLARLGVAATQLTLNSIELQISSQPITASVFDVNAPELFLRRTGKLVEILDADERVAGWYPNYHVEMQ